MLRDEMDRRFGPPGAGGRHLVVGGRRYTLSEVMTRLDLAFEGCRAIDSFHLGPAHFAVRYYDPDEQRIVAYEFDGEFRYVAETRVHIAEWIGEEALAPGQVWPPGTLEDDTPWTSS